MKAMGNSGIAVFGDLQPEALAQKGGGVDGGRGAAYGRGMDTWRSRLRGTYRLLAMIAVIIAGAALLGWTVLPALNDAFTLLGVESLTLVGMWNWLNADPIRLLAVTILAFAAALIVPDFVTLVLEHRARGRLSGDQREMVEGVRRHAARTVGLLLRGQFDSPSQDECMASISALANCIAPCTHQWPEFGASVRKFRDDSVWWWTERVKSRRDAPSQEMQEALGRLHRALIDASASILEPETFWGSWRARAKRLRQPGGIST